MRTTRFAAAICLVLGLSLPLAASAQTGYGGGALTVAPTSFAAGAGFTASGTGYAGSSTVTLSFASDPVVLANVTTNPSGAFTANLTAPANATLGQHTVTASGRAPDNSARILTANVTIVAATAGGQAPLVRTGSSNGPLVIGGALLIAVGFVLVVAVRRVQYRRQRASWS